MRTRRCRWTCTDDSGRQHCVLAYNAAEAQRYYERRGLRVISVRRGDFRSEAHLQGVASGRLNQAAIQEAARMLGLQHPVTVKVSNRKGGARGRHQAVPTGGSVIRRSRSVLFADTATGWAHEIMVKGYLSADNMGRTLWHELAHALQFERDCLPLGLAPAETMKAWHTAYADGTAYSRKPAEVEAREHESLNDDYPLAR